MEILTIWWTHFSMPCQCILIYNGLGIVLLLECFSSRTGLMVMIQLELNEEERKFFLFYTFGFRGYALFFLQKFQFCLTTLIFFSTVGSKGLNVGKVYNFIFGPKNSFLRGYLGYWIFWKQKVLWFLPLIFTLEGWAFHERHIRFKEKPLLTCRVCITCTLQI